MTNPNPTPNPNHIPNRVNSSWKNKPKNMAQAGIRTRVTSLANRDATVTPQRQACKRALLHAI